MLCQGGESKHYAEDAEHRFHGTHLKQFGEQRFSGFIGPGVDYHVGGQSWARAMTFPILWHFPFPRPTHEWSDTAGLCQADIHDPLPAMKQLKGVCA